MNLKIFTSTSPQDLELEVDSWQASIGCFISHTNMTVYYIVETGHAEYAIAVVYTPKTPKS